MLRRETIAVAVASFLILGQAPRALADEPPNPAQSAYFYCSSQPGPVVYFSDFFVASSGAKDEHRINQSAVNAVEKIQTAFLNYLKTKYSFQGSSSYPVGCPFFSGTVRI